MKATLCIGAIPVLDVAIHARLIDWQSIVLGIKLTLMVALLVAQVAVVISINLFNVSLLTIAVDVVHAV